MIKPEFGAVFLNFSRWKKINAVQAAHDRISNREKWLFLSQTDNNCLTKFHRENLPYKTQFHGVYAISTSITFHFGCPNLPTHAVNCVIFIVKSHKFTIII